MVLRSYMQRFPVGKILWFRLLGKSLSDDQTLPHCQLSSQSEPGMLEREAERPNAKETASTTKLNSGE